MLFQYANDVLIKSADPAPLLLDLSCLKGAAQEGDVDRFPLLVNSIPLDSTVGPF